eukprot:scaffold16206_cov134-Isochrysis_galbana.AAC.5
MLAPFRATSTDHRISATAAPSNAPISGAAVRARRGSRVPCALAQRRPLPGAPCTAAQTCARPPLEAAARRPPRPTRAPPPGSQGIAARLALARSAGEAKEPRPAAHPQPRRLPGALGSPRRDRRPPSRSRHPTAPAACRRPASCGADPRLRLESPPRPK